MWGDFQINYLWFVINLMSLDSSTVGMFVLFWMEFMFKKTKTRCSIIPN